VHHARVAAVPDGWSVQLRGRETRFREASSGHAGDGSAARAEPVLRATLPGRVLRVLVAAGDAVRAGDTLLVIEAMKMENPVEAAADGTVEALHVGEGEMVQVGQDLVSLDYARRPPPEASS
jgi:biotin carboxyl carrier protein